MITSKDRLKQDIARVLEAIREEAGGTYACIIDARAVLFEAPEPLSDDGVALRRLLVGQREELFSIPAALAADREPPDLFGAWSRDEFLLAFVNERVVLVLACPDAKAARAAAEPHFEILADRLLRLEERFRIDRQGRGLFFGQPRLDVVVIGGEGGG